MSDKTENGTTNDKSVMIGNICLDELIQPVDYSGVATAGRPIRIQISKPRRDEWVAVRPGEDWQLAGYVIEDKQDMESEIYIVHKDLANGELADDARYAILHLAISTTGRIFWWHIKMGTTNRRNHWAETAVKAVEVAQKNWIRLIPGHESYEIREAKVQMPEPKWPDLSRDEAIQLAFKDRVINSLEHPIARRLILGG